MRKNSVIKPVSYLFCFLFFTFGIYSFADAQVFTNPLGFESVEGFLTSVLVAVQRIIVMLSLIFIVIGAIMYIISGGNPGMVEKGKKAITYSLVGLALGIAAPSFLKEISIILNWGGATTPEVDNALTLTQIAVNVLRFLMSIVGTISIIMIVIGGMLYLTSAGDEDRIDRGKKIFINSLIGIIISLSSLVVVNQIARFFQ